MTKTKRKPAVAVPLWAENIRLTRHGIVFSGGVSWPGSSTYHAAPFKIISNYPEDWNLYNGAKNYLYSGFSFRRARWYATCEFFDMLVGDPINKVPDVRAFFGSSTATGDWTKILVLADKLQDLGHDNEAALVRHFIPRKC